MRFVVWSNIFYTVPLIVALSVHFWVDALALSVLIICSTAFHWFRERRFAAADIAASVAVIIVNAAACVTGGFKTPYFTVVWVLTVAALIVRYYFERGDRGSAAHGYWHALAATILLFCIFVYAR